MNHALRRDGSSYEAIVGYDGGAFTANTFGVRAAMLRDEKGCYRVWHPHHGRQTTRFDKKKFDQFVSQGFATLLREPVETAFENPVIFLTLPKIWSLAGVTDEAIHRGTNDSLEVVAELETAIGLGDRMAEMLFNISDQSRARGDFETAKDAALAVYGWYINHQNAKENTEPFLLFLAAAGRISLTLPEEQRSKFYSVAIARSAARMTEELFTEFVQNITEEELPAETAHTLPAFASQAAYARALIA